MSRLRKQTVKPWPPAPCNEDKEGSVILNGTTFKVLVGNTDCQLRFNLYERPSLPPSRSSNEPSRNESKQKANPDVQLAIET